MIDTIIIGAGLSGLSAAYHLQSKGYQVSVFEATGKVGGRCKSDYLDGYILDRGLHLFQKDHTESKTILDYRTLRLESVYSGAMVHYNNNFHLISNPIKKIKDVLAFSFSPFMTLKDKLNMASLLTFLMTNTDETLGKLRGITTLDFLKQRGFSKKFIDHFFRPLNQANYADCSLQTPACIFTSTMKHSAFGGSALPAYGIGNIAVQLAEKLKEGTVHLHSRVKEVFDNGVELISGEFVKAKSVIVCMPPHEIEKILPTYKNERKFTRVTCMYFATKTPPVNSPIILLNGNEEGLVNNIFVPSTVQRSYAPPGSHLVSVTLKTIEEDMDEDELIDKVLEELIDWFGIKVNDWTHLRTYVINRALPQIKVSDQHRYFEERNGIFFSGDYMSFASVNNAFLSGKSVANAVNLHLSNDYKRERGKVHL